MGLGGIRIRGMKVIAMAVIEKRDGSEMVENRMGWERYELKRWRFGNDGIKRMGIGGLEMRDRWIGRKWGGKVQLVCFFQKNVSRYS